MHWLRGLLLLAIAALGAVVAIELASGIAIAPEVTAAARPSAAAEAPAAGTKFQPPPERQFDEISPLPPFFPSRRPFVPPPAPEAQAAATNDPAAKIELIGVLLIDQERVALVQPEGQPAAHWVHEQQTVAGWLVEEIAADHVRLRDANHVEVVKLRADQARPAAKPEHKRASAGPKDAKAANKKQAQVIPRSGETLAVVPLVGRPPAIRIRVGSLANLKKRIQE